MRTLPVLYALEDDPDGELADLLDGGSPPTTRSRGRSAAAGRGRARARPRHGGGYVGDAVAELDRFGDRPVVAALTRLAGYALDRVG